MSAGDGLAELGPVDERYPELECVPAEQLARLLGKSESWLYTLVRQGRFPHVRVAGSVLFPRRLVARWLEGEFDAAADRAGGGARGRVVAVGGGRGARGRAASRQSSSRG